MGSPQRQPVPVLFVLPTLGTGGSERVVLNICRHINKEAFSPVVVAFRGGALRKDFEDLGIPVYPLKRSGGVDIRLTWKMIRLIRRHRIRVVNSHHFVSLFYAYWAKVWTGISMIHTEHSTWEADHLNAFWNWWFGYLFRRVELASGVSEEIVDYLCRRFERSKERTAVVLNGINVALFSRPRNPSSLREELGLRKNTLLVGSVGNLREEKNHKLLVEALALLKEDGRPVAGVFVGDGPCIDRLKRLADALKVKDCIHWMGTRKDLPEIYPAFDIYCLTSHFEGLPLTLLEAMAAGIPVVGTDVPGIRGLINHRNNGLLVPDNNPRELAEAICLLEKDDALKNALVRRGRRLVKEKFDLRNCVEQYQICFRKLTNPGFPSIQKFEGSHL